MQNKWKRIIAVSCAVAMFMTTPEITVLADENISEELIMPEMDETVSESIETIEEDASDIFVQEEIVSDAEDIEEKYTSVADDAEAETPEEAVGEGEDIVEVDASSVSKEVVLGIGDIDVHDSSYPGTVTATYDSNTGAVDFYSNGGTLSKEWYYDFGTIKSIRVVSGTVYLPPDSEAIFCCKRYMHWHNLYNDELEKIDLRGFDTSNVTDMSFMFDRCTKLTNLDVSGFDTSNVTNMWGMFYDCKNLSTLNVSGFDTSKVESMQEMFYECSKLSSLDVSRFDTSNVKYMSYMFAECLELTNLDVSGFDTSEVVGMSGMFEGCENLTTLDVSRFDTSNVAALNYLFYGCTELTSLDVSGFNTSNARDMSGMFSGCENLTTLDVSRFDTSNVTDMKYMFRECSNVTNLDLSSFDISENCGVLEMLEDCPNLQILITPRTYSEIIELPYTMYDYDGNLYSKIPKFLGGMVLTKEPRQNMGKTIQDTVRVMNEYGEANDEEITFQWGVDKLVYTEKEYDYDLAIAAAYLCSGTYYGEDVTISRMRNLGINVDPNDANLSYDKVTIATPWMIAGSQCADINGTNKTVVCRQQRSHR